MFLYLLLCDVICYAEDPFSYCCLAFDWQRVWKRCCGKHLGECIPYVPYLIVACQKGKEDVSSCSSEDALYMMIVVCDSKRVKMDNRPAWSEIVATADVVVHILGVVPLVVVCRPPTIYISGRL
jgi:hypothetical protein